MSKNEALREYFLEHAKEITEEWYNTIEENDPASIYAIRTPEVVERLKKQNYDFHHFFTQIFVKTEEEWAEVFDEWASEIAADQNHLNTPSNYVIREFMRVRMLYLKYLKRFVTETEHNITQEDMDSWNELIITGFDTAILMFVEGANRNSKELLKAKEDIIQQLSAPVIALDDKRALLPLIGEIDSERAGVILENTLHNCSRIGISQLYIDLSGVATIDTLVAHQISNLIQSLQLLGIKPMISGMRPEIAQTAIQLGIAFEDVTIKSSLANAMEEK
ncbi:RsbT co-antagonist protein RsbRC [Thalassobacillus devorans]|uniref:RsbT co-antagonist protein RsbRC n=1 Tax=Thalassobacillus devorans TaxID=279813 RepID=A0ABQ1PME2_9BACI|nr:STAS domain-containing protein [Thalassobacillus devorans]NIK30275.1 rsbT co-antagonist protein RsbR [Thalassobacillus devorans]GGC99789.1 RsbT co-antagonist protein RsbRC [Thalassobacillus devorans]